MKNSRGALLSFCFLTPCFSLTAADRFVSPLGAHLSPFTDWAGAATNIQDAIDVAAKGETIWVTNGFYASGGKAMEGDLTNRVALDKPLTIQSVNGPNVTIIQGAYDPVATNGPGAIRCAWLTNGATLKGFTLQGGATRVEYAHVSQGGGAYCRDTNAFLVNCILKHNSSPRGGGAYSCTLIGCAVIDNSALYGGGAYSCLMTNCTVTGNYARILGGATIRCTHVNCIVYSNMPQGINPALEATFLHSCHYPLPAGPGNISTDPQLLSDGVHLSMTSPCRGAGAAIDLGGVDIDGQAWSNPPSMGCDEWADAPVAAKPILRVEPSGMLAFEAPVAGQPPLSCWWFKDGSLITPNAAYSGEDTPTLTLNRFHADDAGAYHVVASNEFGVATSLPTPLLFHCVDAAAAASQAPYTNWATAAATIQDAIDASDDGHVVLVTNGLYATGGKVISGDLTNRVALNKAILVQSVNGPAATIIQGGGFTNGPLGLRCAWVGAGARLSGFTLQGGAARSTGDITQTCGGGAWCLATNSQVANCRIIGNSAQLGGGVYQGFVRNTALLTNSASGSGGGSYQSVLHNCTVIGNSAASMGGGVMSGTVINSILCFNTAFGKTNNYLGVFPSYSCTFPLSSGPGNIAADPQLVDGLFLSPGSPCRGAANPSFAIGTDIEGEPWLTPPSMGCDEFHEANLVGPLSVDVISLMTTVTEDRPVPFWGLISGRANRVQWSSGAGSISTNTAMTLSWPDPGDYTLTFTAFNANYPEGVCTNLDIHVLPLDSPALNCAAANGTNLSVTFYGQPAVVYTLQRTPSLTPPILWSTVSSNYGLGGPIQYTEPQITNDSAGFYRLQVE